jgi:uncharacterized membrane protein YbaN (DUF454 family)
MRSGGYQSVSANHSLIACRQIALTFIGRPLPCRKVSDSALIPMGDMLLGMAQVVENRWLRGVYLTLGFLMLGLGIIGAVLPGIPTTMPIIVAAFFFSKSSARFDNWMLNHKVFGPLVRDWRAGVGFSARVKAIAITAIAVTFTITVVWVIDNTAARVGLIVLATGITAYILWLPTKQVGTV